MNSDTLFLIFLHWDLMFQLYFYYFYGVVYHLLKVCPGILFCYALMPLFSWTP